MTRQNPVRDATSYKPAGDSQASISAYAQGWHTQNPGMHPSRLKDIFTALEKAGATVKNASPAKLAVLATMGVLIGYLVGVAAQQAKQSMHDDQVAARTVRSIDVRGHVTPATLQVDAHLDALLTGSEATIKKINSLLSVHTTVAQVCAGALPATSLIGPDVVTFSAVQASTASLRSKLQATSSYVAALDATGGYVSDSRRERIERASSKLESISGACASEPDMAP